jgi:ankyrin repeat protein
VIEDLSTPLHKACAGNKDGHLSAVKQLLAGGADVHALNKWRETPLLTAANHGQATTVKALLDAGADPCRCTDTGWSPLSIAAYKGHDEVVELLLEHGAPTEEEDPTLSALLQAATKGLPNTVQLLLRHGADHTVTTKKGDTALSILVEQNLIDTAVEMVTEYKASVPRCSRDRKKVQRARLLINLRIKQQKEEGKYTSYNDDSDQDDLDDVSRSPLHDNADNTTLSGSSSSQSKKKKKEKRCMSAEEKAKAAAEALLLELEQEDAKAQKEEAAATSKRNKKKKKKERERQQKLEQEKLRREKEEKEAEERRLKEEEEKKAREAKAKELREREMQEAIERQKKAAARQKEKEEKERKRREDERRLQEKREKQKVAEEKRSKDMTTRSRHENQKRTLPGKMAAKKDNTKNRKEENRKVVNISLNDDSPTRTSMLSKVPTSARKSSAAVNPFENIASAVDVKGLDKPVVDLSDNQKEGSIGTLGILSGEEYIKSFRPFVEPATVALVRHEKVTELLRKLSSGYHGSTSIDVVIVRSIIYKWIVRASYDSMPSLDPVIPSWTDKNTLITFMQRQMISESRRVSDGTNMEILKETGSFVAELCESLAREVVEYRNSCIESLSSNISDVALNISASETINSNGQCNIIIDWNGRSKICVHADTFQKLRNRYTGPVHSFLGSVFGLVKRYETLRMILSGTSLNCRLPTATLSVLSAELKVSLELWADPLSVFSVNNFCGMFPDVDTLFGGFRPFVEQNNPVEMLLTQKGGSVAVLPSCDSTTATFFIGRILKILDATEGRGVPLSFAVFLPVHAFRDLATTPSLDDLQLLDPRLIHSHRRFVRNVELLRPGQHYFQEDSNDDKFQVSGSGSIMLILQNEKGRLNFPLSDELIMNILFSMSINNIMPSSDLYQTFPLENIAAAVTSSPNSQQQNQPPNFEINDFGAARSNNSSRRGRFFELVDDGEDDFLNADDMVSGMLSSLDISIFQDNNASQDIDIEAISLMGIGNNCDATSRHEMGRFR